MTLTKSSRDLSEQLGVWLRPDVIGSDAVSRSAPFGPSARQVLGQLTRSVPSEQSFRGKRSVYVLVRDNLASTRRRVMVGRLSLSSVCRRIALNGLELLVFDGADRRTDVKGLREAAGVRSADVKRPRWSERHWQVDAKGLR